ncbi:MAG: hypothetical protein WBP13_00320 [Methylophilaceae bacterium]
MQNSLNNRQSKANDNLTRSKKLRIRYWLLFSFVLFGAIAAQFIIPNFKNKFSGLGHTLPMLTSLVVKFRHLLFILPLYEFVMAVVVTFNSRCSQDAEQAFSIILFIDFLTHIAIFLLVGYAIYLPLLSV